VRRGRPRRAPDLLPVTPAPLRGEAKLRAAIAGFGVDVTGRVCLDLGAAAGGFTRVLLESGAAKVYAVDAGFGQLLGSLRQDPRVVNLEATNVATLDTRLIPEAVEVVSVDVSYLALAAAVAQLDRIAIAPGADLIGLVKPMFELRLARAPVDQETVDAATARAVAGIAQAGWEIAGVMASPVLGGRGAVEALVHARRSL
jgi:23S rRNA (cytidine1920-2'-O)/16S rRNA (cytidine1409-2'-O)-methyltransferase